MLPTCMQPPPALACLAPPKALGGRRCAAVSHAPPVQTNTAALPADEPPTPLAPLAWRRAGPGTIGCAVGEQAGGFSKGRGGGGAIAGQLCPADSTPATCERHPLLASRARLPPVCCVMAAGHGSLIRCVHLPWCTRAVGPSEGPVAQRPQQTRDSFECSSDKR